MSDEPSFHAYVYTFPFCFWTDEAVRTHASRLTVDETELILYGPQRMGVANFLPSPDVHPGGVPFLSGAAPDLGRLHAPTVTCYPGLPSDDEHFSVLIAQGPEFDQDLDPFPADALRVDVHAARPDFDPAVFVSRLLTWIRFQTKQWWVGHPPPSGHARISFAINEMGEPQENAFAYTGPTTAFGDERSVSSKDWKQLAGALAEGHDPPLHHLLLLDARYNAHTGAVRRATLDAAVACEEALKEIAERLWTDRAPDTPFKAGRVFKGDDLRTHLDGDMSRFTGRSLREEHPEVHRTLSDLWLARHSCAHTGRAVGIVDGGRTILDPELAKDYAKAANTCVGWLESLPGEGNS